MQPIRPLQSIDWHSRLQRVAGSLRDDWSEPGPVHPTLIDLLDPSRPLRTAAVLVAAIDGPAGPMLRFTRRTEALRHHAGQISFPGGRLDECDADPVSCALREAEEEIGVRQSELDVLGVLAPYDTISGFRVHPVLAWAPVSPPVRANAGEVAEVFDAPLSFFLDVRNLERHHVQVAGRQRHYFGYRWGDYWIWGATAGIVRHLCRRLDRSYP